jgi:hypothetical protein
VPSRLPGMPLSVDDVHVCKIDDGAPRARRQGSGSSAVRGAPPPRPAVWLVLALCLSCNPRGYCPRHGESYLAFMASGTRRR